MTSEDHEDTRRSIVILEQLHVAEQLEADAARADHAKDGGGPEIGFEAI